MESPPLDFLSSEADETAWKRFSNVTPTTYPDQIFYVIDYDITDLKIKSFGDGYIDQIDWALFIAYNRQPEKLAVFKPLCMRYDAYNKQYDKSDTDQIQAGTGR